MQANTFRQRCGRSRGLVRLPLERLLPTNREGHASMRQMAETVCDKLRADAFTPTLPKDGSAYTNHFWSHTWIRGAEKANIISG